MRRNINTVLLISTWHQATRDKGKKNYSSNSYLPMPRSGRNKSSRILVKTISLFSLLTSLEKFCSALCFGSLYKVSQKQEHIWYAWIRTKPQNQPELIRSEVLVLFRSWSWGLTEVTDETLWEKPPQKNSNSVFHKSFKRKEKKPFQFQGPEQICWFPPPPFFLFLRWFQHWVLGYINLPWHDKEQKNNISSSLLFDTRWMSDLFHESDMYLKKHTHTHI